jgi:putative RNA 2'-phosphotransferase
MIAKEALRALSVRLAYILRHDESFTKRIDDQGWLSVEELIKEGFDLSVLKRIVSEDTKGRYSFRDECTLIRANQGHSLSHVNIKFACTEPPNILYHGTTQRAVDGGIGVHGLLPMSRQHVHLSSEISTAKQVASRRKNQQTVILQIEAKLMNADGYKFYLSDNGVWLTDRVPLKYLTFTRH